MRGANVLCRLQKLQKPTESRTSTGGVSVSYEDLVQFRARLVPISAAEQLLFEKETVIATYKIIVTPRNIRLDNLTELVEKNRIVVDDPAGLLPTNTFDITGVLTTRRSSRQILYFKVFLKKVE